MHAQATSVDSLNASAPPWALPPALDGWDWGRVALATFILVGCGSIGRTLAESLVSLGARHFTLFDPKAYRHSSVAGQCAPLDVGKRKVEVLGERLRGLGASVFAHPHAVGDVEPGAVVARHATQPQDPDTVIIASADKLTGQAESIAAARLHHLPWVRVNLEPSALLTTVRVFDYRRPLTDRCALCSWTPDMVAMQEHAHSCDGLANVSEPERATQSPRALSQLAGSWGAFAATGLVASPSRADAWHGQEWLVSPLGPVLHANELPANSDCIGSHRVEAPPLRIASCKPPTLLDLVAVAGIEDEASLWVSGSGELTRGLTCTRCDRRQSGIRWLPRTAAPPRCPCGAVQHATPGLRTAELPRAALDEVWTQELATWGVPTQAVVTLTGAHGVHHFLISEESS